MTVGTRLLHHLAPSPESFAIEPDKNREWHSHGNCDCGEKRVAHAEAQSLKHLSPKHGERESEQGPADLHTTINRSLGTNDHRMEVGQRDAPTPRTTQKLRS